MDYITIASTGNATNFGTLFCGGTQSEDTTEGISNAHGGL
jgi:hypothetical protein